MNQRIFNFNPGPAALPLPVLEEIQADLLNLNKSGLSILEMSHRAKEFDEVILSAEARVRRLLKLSDDFAVVFIQGGASLQFAMAPMNLARSQTPAYVDTGTWSTKAIKEAQIQGLNPNVVASSADKNYTYIPKDFSVPDEAAYLHFTTNNTIKGTQWRTFPQVGPPLIADMSSDILSRPFDPKPFGLFYAGAQKNLGPAGVCLAVIRQDMLARVPENLPSLLRYTTYVEKRSLFNTPPVFAIYVIELVLKWLEEEIGGVEKMAAINERKAAALYDCMEKSDGFFRPTAEAGSRSLMNVTFRLADEELEKKFLAEAPAAGLGGLKGHRSVGGLRASLYNAVTEEAVARLVDFMTDFAKRNR